MASENIQFNRKLAEDLRHELSDMMYEYDGESNLSGRTIYACAFCKRFCYGPDADSRNINEIEHSKDCLGERLMKELDLQLSID